MAKLVDTTEWREFRVGDLFDIAKGSRLTKKDQVSGDIRFVGSSAVNNGVTGHVGNDRCVFEGDALTVAYNGSVGESFYQDELFWASDDVNVLRRKDAQSFGAGCALFVATLTRYLGKRFGFTSKWNLKVMSDTIVRFPVTPDGKPDWDYMEQYMAHVMDEMRPVAEELYHLDSKLKRHKLDTTEWEMFKVGDLFEVLKTGFIGEGRKIGRATKVPDDEHVVPLTCAKQGNNGVMYWGRDGDFITYENVISVIRDGAVSTGLVYAQEQETGVYSHSYFIRAKDYARVPFLANQFVACVLEKVIYPKYTRDDACIWPKVQNEIIKLPATPDGKPDWDTMAEMMRGYTDSVREVAEVLGKLEAMR